MTFPVGGVNKEALDYMKASIPMQRLGTRTEIAEACVFLSCPMSSYTTGMVMVVDGGEWMIGGRTLDQAEQLSSKL